MYVDPENIHTPLTGCFFGLNPPPPLSPSSPTPAPYSLSHSGNSPLKLFFAWNL